MSALSKSHAPGLRRRFSAAGHVHAWTLAALSLAGIAALSSGCGVHEVGGSPALAASASATATTPPVPGSDAAGRTETTEPIPDWKRAMQAREWERAHDELARLPAHEQSLPRMRLATGVAALRAERHAEAVAALTGLESDLPELAEEIRLWRARAAAVGGPHLEGAGVLVERTDIDDVLLAARAFQLAEEPARSRAAIARAMKLAARSERQLVRVRRARADRAEAAGDRRTALADLTWLVQEHPEQAADLLPRIATCGGTVPLASRLRVLEQSADARNLEDVRQTLDALRLKNPGAAPAVDLSWAKALLHARRYDEAMAAFDRAVRGTTGAGATEIRYLAARASARAGTFADAAARFGAIARMRPANGWTRLAAVREAEALLLAGRNEEAAASYERVLGRTKPPPRTKKHGKRTKHADSDDEEARLGRALAHLGSNRPEEARRELAELARRASPRHAGMLRELEAVAADRAGDRAAAVAGWLELVQAEPLTWASWMAHARLAAIGHTPLPSWIEPPTPSIVEPLAIALPPGPALLHAIGLDDDAETRLVRDEDSVGKAFPGREAEGLCRLYSELDRGRRRQQIGERSVLRDVLMRAPGEAERWAWRCVYPDAHAVTVAREESAHSIPQGLVHAIVRQESAFDATALSPVGARGLMQLMPYTAERIAEEAGLPSPGGEYGAPDVNVRLGSAYLAKLLRQHGGTPALAAAAYNAGPHAVNAWLRSGGERDLDVWVARIPYRETRHYVAAVVGNWLRYRYLSSGAASIPEPSLSIPAAPPITASDY